jgi:hypothetical protein
MQSNPSETVPQQIETAVTRPTVLCYTHDMRAHLLMIGNRLQKIRREHATAGTQKAQGVGRP